MSVMKSGELNKERREHLVFNFRDVEVEANELVENARRQSEQLMSRTQTEAKRAAKETCEKAYKEGHAKGLAEGLAQGREQGQKEAFEHGQQEFTRLCKETLEALLGSLEQFENDKGRLLWEAEQSMVDLSIAVARKVIKREVNYDRQIVVDNVKAALEMVNHTNDVIVRVNSGDMKYLKDMSASLEAALSKYGHTTVEADDEIEPGGCLLVTEQGQIDGKIDTQVELIAEAITIGQREDVNNQKDKSNE